MDISSLVPAGLQIKQSNVSNIPPGYNKISEHLRKYTPTAVQCAIFCGGSKCKYENSKVWPPVHMAIRNIFSHWVTDDVLAMARPSTAQIIQMNVIEQFQEWSIKTIINLQTPGEHASCGGPLEKSGFTYDPSIFMKNGIYYYNFAWKDYGEATTTKLLDMVKVVAFAVQEGRVAIHCHAGLGRTGVLIACYLIYNWRVRASDAIRFVRMKRPSAIQTRGQILCIQEFEHFVLPQMVVYPNGIGTGSKTQCNLQTCLRKQQTILHGYEQRTFKHIPKLVFIICERILQLCDCQEDNSPAEIAFTVSNTSFTQRFICNILGKLSQKDVSIPYSYSWTDSLTSSSLYCLTPPKTSSYSSEASSKDNLNNIVNSDLFCESPDAPSCSYNFQVLDDHAVDDVLDDGIKEQNLLENDCYKEIQSHINLKNAAKTDFFHVIEAEEVIKALLSDNTTLHSVIKKRIQDYQIELNMRSTVWQRLELETDLYVLSELLYEWLESFEPPILNVNDLCQIVIRSSNARVCLQKLQPCVGYLIEYILRFISRLRPMSVNNQNALIKRFMASFTQQKVWINHSFFPTGKHYQKLRYGTMNKLTEFFMGVMNLIEETNTQDFYKSWTTSKWTMCKLLCQSDQLSMEGKCD